MVTPITQTSHVGVMEIYHHLSNPHLKNSNLFVFMKLNYLI